MKNKTYQTRILLAYIFLNFAFTLNGMLTNNSKQPSNQINIEESDIQRIKTKLLAIQREERDLSLCKNAKTPINIIIPQPYCLSQQEFKELIYCINNMKNIPKRIRSLWLTFNNITSLPEELFELTMLEDLTLGFNFITNVPDRIVELPNLKVLNLCNNLIEYMPSKMEQLQKLENLQLEVNKLSKYEQQRLKRTVPSSCRLHMHPQRYDLSWNK